MLTKLSHHVRRRLVTALRPLHARWYQGAAFHCLLCRGSFRKLLPYRGSYFVLGQPRDHFTPNCLCPGCGSDLRHRLVATFLDGVLDTPRAGTLLHFAPEPHLARFLERRCGMTYVPCDLDTRHYPQARRIDITDIDLADQSVDAIVNVHVLEHIDDDRKALRELRRVLRPGGWMVTCVPIYERTVEGTGMTPDERHRMFGVADHRRANGLDFAAKLEQAGLTTVTRSIDDVPGNYVDRNVRSPHIDSDRYLFFSTR